MDLFLLRRRHRSKHESGYVFVYIKRGIVGKHRIKEILAARGTNGIIDLERPPYQLPRSPKMSMTWPRRSEPLSQFCVRPASTASASAASTARMISLCSSTER